MNACIHSLVTLNIEQHKACACVLVPVPDPCISEAITSYNNPLYLSSYIDPTGT